MSDRHRMPGARRRCYVYAATLRAARAPEVRRSRATKINHVLALGVPWAGTLKAMQYLVKGESAGIPGAKHGDTKLRIKN